MYKHGFARRKQRTVEYITWCSIKARCYKPKASGYYKYGARGIKVCDRWLNSFENFLADMGPRPSLTHSIERKDNNGDYAPNNCIWGTIEEQSRNRRSSIVIEFEGEIHILKDWARIKRLPYGTVRKRLRLKWSIADALNTPVLFHTFVKGAA